MCPWGQYIELHLKNAIYFAAEQNSFFTSFIKAIGCQAIYLVIKYRLKIHITD